MIRDPVVLLQNLVLSLSDALDLVHLVAVDHQQRVAYMALRLALRAEWPPGERTDLTALVDGYDEIDRERREAQEVYAEEYPCRDGSEEGEDGGIRPSL